MKQLIDLAEQTVRLKRHEYLKIENTVDTHLYYVVDGSLRVFMLDADEEQIIRFGYKNNFIVCLDSFLTGNASNLIIQAIKATIIKIIPKSKIETLLQEPAQRILWIKILEDLALQQLERERDLLTTSPRERYLRVLKRSPQLFQEIPNKYIANYLRMRPETLSRLKSVD